MIVQQDNNIQYIRQSMNYIVVNSICCCLNLCCKQVWESLYKMIGKTAFIKFAYILVYFGSVVSGLILISLMNSSWSWVMSNLAPGINCNQTASQQHLNCLSASVVYRVSLCLFVFSVLMLAVLQICATRVALVINQGLFFSKFVTIMIAFFATLQLSNQVFMIYGQFAKFVSYAFVACQSMILIDLSYLWGIRWAKRYSQGSRKYAIWLIGMSIIMFGASLAFLIASFTAHDRSLLWADILCCIQVAIMIGIQLLNFNKQNSLLTTSSLCLLVCYCTWAAGHSHPVSQSDGKSINQTILYINMAVSVLLLIFSTAGSIYGSTNAQQQNQFIDLDQVNGRAEIQHEYQQEQKNKWLQWLLYLTGMSTYMAMIVTDWGSADIVTKEFNLTTGAWTSKLVMGTTIFVMYTWSLLAPRLCPNRNFYFQ